MVVGLAGSGFCIMVKTYFKCAVVQELGCAKTIALPP
jgi:hypothetical protein